MHSSPNHLSSIFFYVEEESKYVNTVTETSYKNNILVL